MSDPVVRWKMGVEIELLAPPARSRKTLAEAIAATCGGSARRIFHAQGEPSKVPGTPVFDNLTLGFTIEDAERRLLAHCVDDLTLQSDLDRERPPRPGWYRIVSDDARLLRLIARHADASDPLERVLEPAARLFGGTVDEAEGGMVRLIDAEGVSVAIGAPLPGERERPCELITPPIETDHLVRIDALLSIARSLDFSVPAEGAIHLHFDAERLCEARVIANLVCVLDVHGPALRARVGTNPLCRRLGPLPSELVERVSAEEFRRLDWVDAVEELQRFELTKYCDFNLRNVVSPPRDKHTFEVRILPVSTDARRIVEWAGLFAAILEWATDPSSHLDRIPSDLRRFG